MSDQSLLDGVDGRARLKVENSTLAPGGLGLTAAVAIPELDDVFFKPQLLYLANNDHLDSTCDGCFMWLGDSINYETCTVNVETVRPTLKKCSGCEVVRYCSKSCQRKAWDRHHKAECRLFAYTHPEDVTIRAALRLLGMRKLGVLDDNAWYWVNRMQSHMENYYHRDPEHAQTMSETASVLLEWTGMEGSEESVKELIYRISVNHMVDDRMEGEEVGITVDPLAGVINHSCDPNATYILEGANIRIRSLRHIEAGEEITIAYTDVTFSRDQRRQKLADWFFDCASSPEIVSNLQITLQLNKRTFIGVKCSKDAFDDAVKVPVGCDQAALSAAALEFDHHNPQKGDSALFGPGGPGAGWDASFQPIPHMHDLLARAWRAKTMFSDPTTSHEVQLNLLNELRHQIALCLRGEPTIRPLKEHPRRVENLFMLVTLLRRIFLVQQETSAFPGFGIERAEIEIFYRSTMLTLEGGVSRSHGKESPFAVAVNKWVEWDIRAIGNPATVLDLVDSEEMPVPLRQAMMKLLRYSGLPLGE